MKWPPEIPACPKPLKEFFRVLVERININEPRDGFGIRVADANGGGKSINAQARGGSGGGVGISPHPFKLSDATEEEVNKIRVRYGTVAGVAPDGMSLGDVPTYVLDTVGASGKVYLIVTVDTDGEVDSRTIDIGASLPDDTDDTFHQEIGSYSIADGTLSIAQAISGSQEFELCGGVEPLWGLV